MPVYIYIYTCIYVNIYIFRDISFYHDIFASKKPTQHDMSKKYGIPANSPLNRQNETSNCGAPYFQTNSFRETYFSRVWNRSSYLVWGSKVFL